MKVSIVIPAHNAAATLAETLISLQAQTCPDWEAIVVDDGSSDETVAIAESFAERDPRVRMVSQSQKGEAAARNTGISLARFDWLLFLDADDWLLPQYLERFTNVRDADPGLDAVHCGWVRVAPDGRLSVKKFGPQPRETFTASARYCPWAIHACVVRRWLVEAVGGFDTALRTCPDWDLWQRIARAGARFGVIPDVLARYRMRPDSAGANGLQLLADGLCVIARGHAPDPRVPHPDSAYADGLPVDELSGARFYWTCWTAGLILGRGEDARPLLEAVKEDCEPALDAWQVAQRIFEAALLPSCQVPAAWLELWPYVERHLNEFLLVLEVQSRAPGLVRRVRTVLEQLILQYTTVVQPLTVGGSYAVRIEITKPIPDLYPPAIAERLNCVVELEGRRIGTLEVPICDGFVPAYLLADAIAAEFAWLIIGRFFEYTVYPELRIEREPGGLSLHRGTLCLATELPESAELSWSRAHDQVGWTIFLQELWGCPDWPRMRFDDPQPTAEPALRRHVGYGWLPIEVSEDLPDVEVRSRALDVNVLVTVGGSAVGLVTLPVTRGIIYAQELRAAITSACGFELCRVAVREALLGTPLIGLDSLRVRLDAVAAASRHCESAVLGEPANVARTPGWRRAISRVVPTSAYTLLLGRRANGQIGTSVSRRAVLPAAAADELSEAAVVAGEPVFPLGEAQARPVRVAYVPDLLWNPPQRSQPTRPTVSYPKGRTANRAGSRYERNNFELLFATCPDPFHSAHCYEQTKDEQTLTLLPRVPIRRALELGCGEGHFTVKLASRVDSLTAVDFSQVALNRAAERSVGLPHVNFVRFDIAREPLVERFDLIVCIEVLYYVGGRGMLQGVARKLADALEPGGYLLTVHEKIASEEPDGAGYQWNVPFGARVIGDVLASTAPLQLVKEIRTPLYRIQLFWRPRPTWLLSRRCTPQVTELAHPSSPPPGVVARDLGHDGRAQESAATAPVTERLPILMYHRIAPTSSPAAARYRVTPKAFGEQLQYLHDAGFYSVSLNEWHTAMTTHRPLPGRAVILTFDDGYFDFFTYAWPVLQRYDFSALVFLVAEEIGGSNRWDHVYRYGEEVPLLGWKEILQLQNAGIEFGSHSATHPYLTALSCEDIVREGARSRAILERGLGRPVTAFAYPHGAEDRAIQHLIGGCGYTFGLSTRTGLSGFSDPRLSLPRVEVTGSDRLQDFIQKLHP